MVVGQHRDQVLVVGSRDAARAGDRPPVPVVAPGHPAVLQLHGVALARRRRHPPRLLRSDASQQFPGVAAAAFGQRAVLGEDGAQQPELVGGGGPGGAPHPAGPGLGGVQAEPLVPPGEPLVEADACVQFVGGVVVAVADHLGGQPPLVVGEFAVLVVGLEQEQHEDVEFGQARGDVGLLRPVGVGGAAVQVVQRDREPAVLSGEVGVQGTGEPLVLGRGQGRRLRLGLRCGPRRGGRLGPRDAARGAGRLGREHREYRRGEQEEQRRQEGSAQRRGLGRLAGRHRTFSHAERLRAGDRTPRPRTGAPTMPHLCRAHIAGNGRPVSGGGRLPRPGADAVGASRRPGRSSPSRAPRRSGSGSR